MRNETTKYVIKYEGLYVSYLAILYSNIGAYANLAEAKFYNREAGAKSAITWVCNRANLLRESEYHGNKLNLVTQDDFSVVKVMVAYEELSN